MTRGPRLALLGKQGAGKGTQAARLAEYYGVPHLSTGDFFRDAAAAGTELGLRAKAFMDRGELVPDAVVVGVVEEQLPGIGFMRGGVLDGFPRTLYQAQELARNLAAHPLDVVIDLDVPTEVVLHRISGRRVCAGCGRLYQVEFVPWAREVCDECGSEVVQRDDDTEESVMRRLEIYEIETLPVIHFYRRAGTLAHVDGEGETDEIFKKIVDIVDDRFDPSSP